MGCLAAVWDEARESLASFKFSSHMLIITHQDPGDGAPRRLAFRQQEVHVDVGKETTLGRF